MTRRDDVTEVLILVAAHAVYVGRDFAHPERDENWCLQAFQRGEPPFYLEHIRAGVELAARDPSSLLVFSGGQTRREAGPRSEAEGYRALAEHFRWWGHDSVAARCTTEEFARDSFENVLFGLCRFKEVTGRYPAHVAVVSWAFKAERFDLHRAAIRWPAARFAFHGVNQPFDLEAACAGESRTIAAFRADPTGVGPDLGGKRIGRDPFHRVRLHRYAESCPELADLLAMK